MAVNNIMRSLEGACSKSNLDFKATVFRRVAICAAGIQDRSEYVTLHNAISLYIRKAAPNIQDFILVPDFVAAWYAVFQGEHNQRDSGAIIIGGTGHAVYGRNGNRQHFILDFNQKFNFREFSALSGNIVTLRAAEVLLRQIRKNQFDDYSYHSPLRDEVRKAFASGNLWSRHRNMTLRQLLIDLVRNSERTNQPQILSVPELGAMAPYFVKAARKGDADAIHILENASNNTAILVARVVNAIGLQRQPFEIGIIGSFFFSIKEERIIKKDLAVFAPYATVRREKVETENGLTLMAHRNDRRYEVK